MARTVPKTAERETLRECVHPFSYDSAEHGGAPVTITVGTRLRPDHEAVRVGGTFFVPEDTPHDERPGFHEFVTVHGTQTERPERKPDGWRRPGTGGLRLGA